MMLAFKFLLRNWRSGELKLLGFALVLAVTVVCGISVFTARLERTLASEPKKTIGADAVITGSQPHKSEWDDAAQAASLQQTTASVFASMVFAGDEMHLASVKSVGQGYPLRGEVRISRIPFTLDETQIEIANRIPAEGEIWIDSRLVPLLKIKLGDKVAVGQHEFTATQVIISEPDSANPLSVFGARVLMNNVDLEKTQVVQPGSRIEYRWLLASNDEDKLDKFTKTLEPQLDPHYRLIDIDNNQRQLGSTLKTAKQFLLLSAVIAVLLAGVAIAIAARQFSVRHTDQVALMKALGLGAKKIRSIYFTQLFVFAGLASAVGLCLGYFLQEWVAHSLLASYQLVLKPAETYPYLLSFLSGVLCLVFFALPALWYLPKIPPLKILRRELTLSSTQAWTQALLAFIAVLSLVFLFSRDVKLALSIAGTLVLVMLITLLIASGLYRFSKKYLSHFGGIWRLAFANLQRNQGETLLQILVFSIAFMLLLSLTLVRSSLIKEWQAQIPTEMPNHFLVNIPQEEVAAIQQMLESNQIKSEPVYPMMRARLVAINDRELSAEDRKKSNALRRELNITWSSTLADDNKLVEGQWWNQWKPKNPELPGVSVEKETATALDLSIGDKLQFSFGGILKEAEVASIRSLEWSSMRPNFYFIFSPGSLEKLTPTFITSVFIPKEKKSLVNQLLLSHPRALLIELDRIIAQIQQIIEQVSDGVFLVLCLTLAAGSLVLFAAVISSLQSRKQQTGVIRAFGAPRKLILGSLVIEFTVLGLLAGIVAVIGTESLLLSLQTFVLNTPIQPHYLFWLIAPTLGATLVAVLGYVGCYSVVRTPPAIVLREV
jgi:putative ABC transport system permease protein